MVIRDYTKSKIYCIRNYVNDDVYVGSTIQPLSKRMGVHKGSRNLDLLENVPLYKSMRDIGAEHFYIELIEECPCDNLEQLRKIEGRYIREIGTLNKNIAGRTAAQWYVDNVQRMKEYTESHKQDKKIYNEEYHSREDVKLRRQNKNKITYMCGCGRIVTLLNKPRHEKGQTHLEIMKDNGKPSQ